MTKPETTTNDLINLIQKALSAGQYSPKAIAAVYFNIPLTEVTREQRQFVKDLAFPFVYGQQKQGSTNG